MTDFEWCAGIAGYVFGRCIFECFDLCLGNYAYISASIVVQLLGIAVPYFQRMQREGESGRRKINQITRYLTIIILILQGSAYLTNLHAQIQPNSF